jgi:transposase
MLRRISLDRSEELRQAYRDEMRHFVADNLIFLDESIFNEKTGWRHQAYAPIGSEARYEADLRRGRTWSICAAMSLNGWLPCTGIRQGYYNRADFLNWLTNELLPTIRQRYTNRTMVIILDNLSVHCAEEIIQAIQTEGHIVRFLPPYSPDFNLIELSFSVLKAWIRRYYHFFRPQCEHFGEFLWRAIIQSRCDRFARSQFRHSADGIYIEQEELDRLYLQLQAYERGEVDLVEEETGEETGAEIGREIGGEIGREIGEEVGV